MDGRYIIVFIALAVLLLLVSAPYCDTLREGIDGCPTDVVQMAAANQQAVEDNREQTKRLREEVDAINPMELKARMDMMETETEQMKKLVTDFVSEQTAGTDVNDSEDQAVDKLMADADNTDF